MVSSAYLKRLMGMTCNSNTTCRMLSSKDLALGLLIMLSIIMSLPSGSFAQSNPPAVVDWAVRAGNAGGDADDSFCVSTFPDGSSVISGYFGGSASFGATTLTSGGASDIFVAKVNIDGTFAWASQAGGTAGQLTQDISALADGSSIMIGSFGYSSTFGSITLTGGNMEAFVAKVAADGSFAWAKRAGGSGNDDGQSVATLDDGSSIVTGYFDGTATFGSTTLTSSGDKDIFIAKLSPNGSFVWATRAGGSDFDSGLGIATNEDGSSFVTGFFRATATFGSTTLISASGLAPFIAKLNADGTFAWAIKAGSGGQGQRIATFADGSSVTVGYFSSPSTFGDTTLTPIGVNDAFITKVNSNGTFAWTTQAGAPSGGVSANDVSTLSDGSILVAEG